MLQLRVVGEHRRLSGLGTWLEDAGHARNTTLLPAFRNVGDGLLLADIGSESTGAVLTYLDETGISRNDVTVLRLEEIGPAIPHGRSSSLIWADMVGFAQRNARPLARYVVFMSVAGVIAGYGVITVNSTLIVGAMAVSPDLLPICATSVGLVGGNYVLARRAFATLTLGLGLVVVTAMVLSALLKWTGFLPDGFHVEQSSLNTLAHTDYSTVLVALAAGVAGMLSFETRASAAVGVAISVTTIPASAYLGVALGAGGIDHAMGALVVLLINVSLLIVSGSLTLLVQRVLPNRSGAPV